MSLDVIKYVSISNAVTKQVITEYIPDKTNYGFSRDFKGITQQILESADTMQTSFGKAYALKDPGANAVFVVLTQNYYPEATARQFLEDLRLEFVRAFPGVSTNIPTGEQKFLVDLCKKYNSAAKSDKLTEVQQRVGETREVMRSNVANMLDVKDQATTLEIKSSQLSEQAQTFHKTSEELRRQMMWRNIRFWLIVLGVAGLIIGIIVWSLMGKSDKPKSE